MVRPQLFGLRPRLSCVENVSGTDDEDMFSEFQEFFQ